MTDELDRRVLDALAQAEAPEHTPGYYDARRRLLASAERRRQAAAGRRRGRLRLMAAAATAAVVLALVLVSWAGLPGTRVGGPETATAAEVIAKVGETLGRVRSLSGKLVLVTASEEGPVKQTWHIDATARGDLSARRTDGREFIIHNARSRTTLHVERPADGEVLAYEALNVAAGRPDVGPPDFPVEREVASVVIALAAAKSPSVREADYLGRPCWILSAKVQPNLVAWPSSTGDRLTVTVEKATGFPLRIRETRGRGELVSELRFTELALNRPIDRGTFALSAPGDVEVSKVDYGFRRTDPAGAAAVVGYEPLVPKSVPQGFTLREVTVAKRSTPTGKEAQNPPSVGVVSLGYSHGFKRFVVSTRRAGVDPSRWTDPLDVGEGYRARVREVHLQGGLLSGSPAMLATDLRGVPHLWAVGRGLVVVVQGDLSESELVAVAQSLQRTPDGDDLGT